METSSRTPESRFSTMMSSFMPANSFASPEASGQGIQLITYNTISILISITIVVVLNQIYWIFLPSIKALVWALLLGSALFRCKFLLRNSFDVFFEDLCTQQHSLTFGLGQLPFKIVTQVLSYFIRLMDDNLLFFIVFHFRNQICSMLSILGSILGTMLTHNQGILTLLVGIILAIQFYLMVRNSYSIFNFMPSIILLVVIYLFGTIGFVLFSFIFVFISIGVCIITYDFFYKIFNDDGTITSLSDKFQSYAVWLKTKFASPDSVDGAYPFGDLGKLYMSMLLIIYICQTVEYLELNIIIFVVYLAVKLIKLIFNLTIVQLFLVRLMEIADLIERHISNDSIYQTIAHFFFKGDQFILKALHNSIDLISTLGVLLTVIVLIIFASTYLVLKVYDECSMLITFIQKNDYIVDGIKLTIDQVSNRFVKMDLKSNLTEGGDDNNLMLMMIKTVGKIDWHDSIEPQQSNNTFYYSQIILANPMFQAIEDLFSFIDLKSIVLKIEHVFYFVQSRNISYMPVVKTILTTLNSFVIAILDSGSLLVNFLLNTIVFSLALFYLLSTSKTKYKPIEFMDNFINSLLTDTDSNRLSCYVEEVISSIFVATIKISVFYFIHTWLLYSLFSLQICYIPSVVAAILAAIPFPLPAYSASIPGAIFIYYFDSQFNLIKSIAFFIIALMPSLVVDSSIYSGIKRSIHPYLISISITSGIVYFGVEGAVFGPLFLSLVFIIVNMFTSLAENKLTGSQLILNSP